MGIMHESEIKNISELINPSLDKIKAMSKSFSLTEFYKLNNELAVIAITPIQVVIVCAPTSIDSNNIIKHGHYVAHRELSGIINKKIYDESIDISGKSDPMIKLYCYTSSISKFCYPYNGQQQCEKTILTESMMNVIEAMHDKMLGMPMHINSGDLKKLRGMTSSIQKEEDLNLVPENFIGITHADFIEKLKYVKGKTNITAKDTER